MDEVKHYHLGCPDPECTDDTFCACGEDWPCAEAVAAEVADTDADILTVVEDDDDLTVTARILEVLRAEGVPEGLWDGAVEYILKGGIYP